MRMPKPEALDPIVGEIELVAARSESMPTEIAIPLPMQVRTIVFFERDATASARRSASGNFRIVQHNSLANQNVARRSGSHRKLRTSPCAMENQTLTPASWFTPEILSAAWLRRENRKRFAQWLREPRSLIATENPRMGSDTSIPFENHRNLKLARTRTHRLTSPAPALAFPLSPPIPPPTSPSLCRSGSFPRRRSRKPWGSCEHDNGLRSAPHPLRRHASSAR